MSVMSIRTNVSSLNAQRNLFQTSASLDSAFSRLSSGFRITRAGDDAAGLGVSVNLQAQIRSLSQASRNAQDGLSVVQTAEGGMDEISNLLTRMRELSMQAASDGIGNTERGYIQDEVTQVINEIDRIANATEFNGTKLLDGSASTLDFQVGIRNVAANDRISFTTVDATAATLGVDTIDVSTGKAAAQTALDTIDTALQTLSSTRSTLGAVGNRFQSAIATIQNAHENLSAANSRIRDVNVAEETSRLSRAQVRMQAGVAVLAQANQMPQLALRLLG